jgi:copper oxidase (laccase) domain-containing protein
MKDDAIRRRPAERDALVEAGVRAFCLTNAQLCAAEQTERFVSNRHRILQQARKPGPYIYGVYERRLRRLWPT